MALHGLTFAQEPAEPELTGQPWMSGIADVVLTQVTMQPVGEIEKAIIHREHQVGNQPGHGNGPAFQLHRWDRDHIVSLPLAVLAMTVPQCTAERCPHERMGALWIMVEANLQRDQPVLTQVDALREFVRVPIPE